MKRDRNNRKSPALWVQVSAQGIISSKEKYSFGFAFMTVSCTLNLKTFDRWRSFTAFTHQLKLSPLKAVYVGEVREIYKTDYSSLVLNHSPSPSPGKSLKYVDSN